MAARRAKQSDLAPTSRGGVSSLAAAATAAGSLPGKNVGGGSAAASPSVGPPVVGVSAGPVGAGGIEGGGVPAGFATSLPGRAGGTFGGIAAEKRTPQATRSAIVSYDLFSTEDYGSAGAPGGGGVSFQNQYRKGNRGAAAQGGGGIYDSMRTVDGAPFVWQMIIEHLRKSPAAPVAVSLQSELREMGIGPEYYIPDQSPLDLGAKATSVALQMQQGALLLKSDALLSAGHGHGGDISNPDGGSLATTVASALVQILYPASHVREGIMALLRDTPEKLRRQRQVPSGDAHLLGTLVKQAVAPMWLDPCAAPNPSSSASAPSVATSATLAFSKTSGNILAASVNELVEHMTSCQLSPHLTVTSKSRQLNEKLCMEVFLTCEHFTTRHALLAKLLQRFHVPMGLGLRVAYSRHGIFIDIPSDGDVPGVPKGLLGVDGTGVGPSPSPLSPEGCIRLAIVRLVQLKVAAVVTMWAHHFASHFDPLMREVVYAWLDECCMGTTEWADSASELQCCAESIRCSLWEGDQGDASLPPSLVGYCSSGGGDESVNGGGVGSGIAPSYLMRDISRPPPRQVSSAASLRAAVRAFWSLNLDHVASLIRSINYQLLRAVTSEQLYTVAMFDGFRASGGGGAGAGGAVGMPLSSAMVGSGREAMTCLVARFEVTAAWSLNTLLDAVEVDMAEGSRQQQQQTWPCAIQTLQHILTLCFKLLSLSDFHGCLAVFSGVLHPSFATVYRHVLQRYASAALNKSLRELIDLFDFSNAGGPRGGGNAHLPTSSGAAAYKAALAECAATASIHPPIPLIHVLVDELRAIETSQPSVLCDESSGAVGQGDAIAIHWRKMSVIATIYQQVRACQSATSLGVDGGQGAHGMGGYLGGGGEDGSSPKASLPNRVKWIDSLMGTCGRSKEELVDVSTRAFGYVIA